MRAVECICRCTDKNNTICLNSKSELDTPVTEPGTMALINLGKCKSQCGPHHRVTPVHRTDRTHVPNTIYRKRDGGSCTE